MKRLKALITTAVFLGAIYVGWRLLPVYFSGYQFQQDIQTISREGAYGGLNEDQLRARVKERIIAGELPLKADDVRIVRGMQDVMISATYTVHVDLPIHPLDLTFTPAAHNGEKVEVQKPQAQ